MFFCSGYVSTMPSGVSSNFVIVFNGRDDISCHNSVPNRTGEKQMALELYDLPILLVTCMIRLKYAPLSSRTIIYTVWHNIE